MKSRVAPYILSATAMLAMTALSACNKKGSGGARPISGPAIPGRPSVPAQQIPIQGQPLPQPQIDQKDLGKAPLQQNPQNSDNDSNPTPCINGDEAECDRNADSDDNVVPTLPGKAQLPVNNGGSGASEESDDLPLPVIDDSKGQQGADIPVIREKMTALELHYTSAGRDAYRSHLTAVMTAYMRNADLKDAYYRAVSNVVRVKALLIGKSMRVTVVHRDSGKEKIIMLAGTMNMQSGVAHISKLKNAAAQTGQESSLFSDIEMSGTVVCADASDRTCQVMLIRLQVGSEDVPVWVIHRTTNADLGVSPWQGPTGYAFADRMYQYFINTGRQNLESVNTIIIDSFEVINGASGMKITTLMHDNQVVSARGGLLAPKESILTNVAWKRDLEIGDLYNENARSGFRSNLQDSLAAVHLIGNDGYKEFTLLYSFPSTKTEKAVSMAVIYTRHQTLVKNIDAIRAIFSAAKVRTEL